MSRVYFHTPSNEAELLGAERHHMAFLTNEIFVASAGFTGYGAEYIVPLLEPDCYLLGLENRKSMQWQEALCNFMSHGERDFVIGGRRIPIWNVALNTAMALGGDALKLCARLHAQCEIHAYVEGPNRAWLADIIEAGRRLGILRDKMGWEDVVRLLRERADEPVVTSYSVTEQFPNQGVAMRLPKEKLPEGLINGMVDWYEMESSEQWRLCIEALRTTDEGFTVELKPDNWDHYHFGPDPITAFDLRRLAQEASSQPLPTSQED